VLVAEVSGDVDLQTATYLASIAALDHKGTGACGQNAVSVTGNYIP
jgi:hypothetical protein